MAPVMMQTRRLAPQSHPSPPPPPLLVRGVVNFGMTRQDVPLLALVERDNIVFVWEEVHGLEQLCRAVEAYRTDQDFVRREVKDSLRKWRAKCSIK